MGYLTPDIGTSSTYDYLWLSTHKEHFTFTVMACHDAHVALATMPDDLSSALYEVVIGGYKNQRTDIRKGPGVSHL